MLEDVIVLFSAAISAAFVVMSVMLMVRYRRLASVANESSKLAKDLWDALEERLKHQNERIVDLMAKVEVYGAQLDMQMATRTMGDAPRQTAQGHPRDLKTMKEESEVPQAELRPRERNVRKLAEPDLRVVSADLAHTEARILKALVAGPRTSAEIRQLVDRSREHTARLMKNLFEAGLLQREMANKPFVYTLTDEGRRYVETASG